MLNPANLYNKQCLYFLGVLLKGGLGGLLKKQNSTQMDILIAQNNLNIFVHDIVNINKRIVWQKELL